SPVGSIWETACLVPPRELIGILTLLHHNLQTVDLTVMRIPRKAVVLPSAFVIFGGVGIWNGLVHLATRQTPIFGDANNHDPKWIALDILCGIIRKGTPERTLLN